MKRKRNLRIACLIDDDIVRHIRASRATSTRAKYDLSVVKALHSLYREVVIVGVGADIKSSLHELVRLAPDVAFNLAFSAQEEEAVFARALARLDMPFTGSGAAALALANDKLKSRRVLQSAGIAGPRSVELRPRRPVAIGFPPPFIVKPVVSAGCDGIRDDSLVMEKEDVLERAKVIWRRDVASALCEEFIVGREFRIGLVAGPRTGITVVGITEWTFGTAAPGWGFKTWAVVNNPKIRNARRIGRGPAAISRRQSSELAAIAQRATAALGVEGYASVDIRTDRDGRAKVIEVNANPGLWSGSSIWSRPNFRINIRNIVAAALRK
jgi:D-alanine-D-alanine ligase